MPFFAPCCGGPRRWQDDPHVDGYPKLPNAMSVRMTARGDRHVLRWILIAVGASAVGLGLLWFALQLLLATKPSRK